MGRDSVWSAVHSTAFHFSCSTESFRQRARVRGVFLLPERETRSLLNPKLPQDWTCEPFSSSLGEVKGLYGN